MDTEQSERVDDVARAVAAALKGKMAERNISQVQLSALTGIPVTTLHRWINGKRAMPFSKFVAIASAIGVEPGKIIESAHEIRGGT